MLISRERILSLLQKGQHLRTLADGAAVGSEQWGGDSRERCAKASLFGFTGQFPQMDVCS